MTIRVTQWTDVRASRVRMIKIACLEYVRKKLRNAQLSITERLFKITLKIIGLLQCLSSERSLYGSFFCLLDMTIAIRKGKIDGT